jgi:hypothetical protein
LGLELEQRKNIIWFYSSSLDTMQYEAELGIRRLVLTASTFAFLLSMPIIFGLQFFPPDHGLRSTLTAYFILFLVVSFVGIIAGITVRPAAAMFSSSNEF